VTDLAGERLDSLVADLGSTYGPRVAGVPLDVTDAASIASAFADGRAPPVGGVDLVIANAGLAHVASLAEMDLETFRKLERVNVEGTLLVLAEASGTSGTRAAAATSCSSPRRTCSRPARAFGAYSATKAPPISWPASRASSWRTSTCA